MFDGYTIVAFLICGGVATVMKISNDVSRCRSKEVECEIAQTNLQRKQIKREKRLVEACLGMLHCSEEQKKKVGFTPEKETICHKKIRKMFEHADFKQ